MLNIHCPICDSPVILLRVSPLEPGTVNPYGYDFHCEHCFCDIGGRHYLRFFGVCYADRQIKYFILRAPLQNDKSVLMLERLQDRYSIRFFKAEASHTFLEEKVALTPKEAYDIMFRIQQLTAFT